MYNVHVYTTCTIERHMLCLHLHIHTHVGKGGWIFFCFKETLYLGGFIFACFSSLSFGKTTELIFYIFHLIYPLFVRECIKTELI